MSENSKSPSCEELKEDRNEEPEKRKLEPWEWPWQGQLLLLVLVFLAATLIFVFPPAFARLLGASPEANGGATWVAPYVGLTAVLISGIFLFMTLRIDRGAKLEAGNVAREQLDDATLRKAREAALRNLEKIRSASRESLRLAASARDAAGNAAREAGGARDAATAAESARDAAKAAATAAESARDAARAVADDAENTRDGEDED